MTSTTGTAGHPDVTEISDLAEGLLPPSRTTDLRRHLDECELCADVHASLEEIRELLGTLPGPPAMSAEVADRIDAALAAEALLLATATEAADNVDSDGSLDAAITSPSATEPAEDAHVSRETSPASAVSSRPSGHAPVAHTGPGRKQRGKINKRRGAILGAVFTVAALGFGSVLLSSLNDGEPSGREAQGQSTAADTFAEGTLEKDVSDLLAKDQSARSGSRDPETRGEASAPGSSEPKLLQAPRVPECIQKGIGRSDSALATEKGTYQGTDALLVVLRHPSDSGRVTAYVMDASCEADPSLGSAKVLLKRSYSQS